MDSRSGRTERRARVARALPATVDRRALRVFLMLVLLTMLAALRAAAVSVSPVALYIDNRTRSGTLTLYNPGTLPEEVEIDFAFGYPVSDEDGNVSVPLLEEAPEGEPSAVSWLRAFPRRLVLEPGQRQVVRVMVQPPAGLARGEYWARVLVKGRGGQPPIEQQRGDVKVQINVETVVVVALNYRNGEVSTGLRVLGAEARRTADGIAATIDLERQGNAAFLGRVRAELVDANGRVVGTSEEVLAVYHAIRRRLVVPAPADTPGPLRVRFTMDTERDDLPQGAALPGERVTQTVDVQ